MDEPFASVIETHISTVFFAGDRAYKLLKPLRTGFLDHSTSARREEAVRREYMLNRRIADDVYLGISPIVERDEVVDYMLVMQRLPTDRRLSSLLSTGEGIEAVREVARAVAVFHGDQMPDSDAARVATVDFVRGLWRHNLIEMQRFAGTLLNPEHLSEVESLALHYLAGRRPLFNARIIAGCAIDGHGDLLAQDIFCLADGPRILDCLAFDDDLRHGDVLLDVAFLAMDIEHLADRDMAGEFIRSYQEFSNEHHPQTLLDHYIAYRALVRCKVACLRADQGGEGSSVEAQALLDLALGYLRAARVRLVLVGGSPGSGKSTMAEAVAARHGWSVLSSDELRKDLTGVAHYESAAAPPDTGIYTVEVTESVYSELIRRAGVLLSMGETVVLDASWTSASSRQAARDLAQKYHAEVIELRCTLDPAVARQRIEQHVATSGSVSDATPEIGELLAARADSWPEAVRIDTEPPLPDVIDAALDAVGRRRVD